MVAGISAAERGEVPNKLSKCSLAPNSFVPNTFGGPLRIPSDVDLDHASGRNSAFVPSPCQEGRRQRAIVAPAGRINGYDFIVVGAGAAAPVIAASMSENDAVRVLLAARRKASGGVI